MGADGLDRALVKQADQVLVLYAGKDPFRSVHLAGDAPDEVIDRILARACGEQARIAHPMLFQYRHVGAVA